jgi:Alpha/beta hydrolase family
VDHIGKPFVMVGHSMGSAIAELVAAARPDRAMGLALLAPVPLAGVGMPAEAIASFRGLGGDKDGQRALRKQLSVGMSDPDLERIVAAGAQLRPEVVATLADCWNQGHPDGSGPSRYPGPGLVLTGAGDPFVTTDVVSAGVTSRLPQATTAVVDGAGHWPHMEQASAVAARIGEFLEQTIAGSRPKPGSRDGCKPSRTWPTRPRPASPRSAPKTWCLRRVRCKRPVEGRDLVKVILATASGIYDSLAFTHEAGRGSRTYLEWEATAFDGVKMSGIRVLTKNADGKIARAAIHHRPPGALHMFSGELRRRLDGTVDSSYFHGG